MEIYSSINKMAFINAAKHLRLKSRVIESVKDNKDLGILCLKLYTVKVQVKVLGVWVTVWVETCDYCDGDTRPYIRNRAKEVHNTLTVPV